VEENLRFAILCDRLVWLVLCLANLRSTGKLTSLTVLFAFGVAANATDFRPLFFSVRTDTGEFQ
tara:strand:- start:218 stop:409 length:192 start_codon:yes stop_codon:yes gene_type:complete